MWGCFLMSGVKILHFLIDWWKSIPVHQNYTMALTIIPLHYTQLLVSHYSYSYYLLDAYEGGLRSSLNWLITLHILLIRHHLFSVPQHEKHLAGKQHWTDDKVISAVEDFFLGSGWELLYHRNPSAATPMEEVCGPQGRLCWKINIWSNLTIASESAYELFSPLLYLW